MKDQKGKQVDEDWVFSQVLSPGEWFQFPKIFLRVMTVNEAMMLAFLLGHRYKILNRDDTIAKNGKFYCKIQTMQKELNISRRNQSIIIKKLVDLGVLGYKMEGNPAKRWMWINFTNLKHLLMNCRTDED